MRRSVPLGVCLLPAGLQALGHYYAAFTPLVSHHSQPSPDAINLLHSDISSLNAHRINWDAFYQIAMPQPCPLYSIPIVLIPTCIVFHLDSKAASWHSLWNLTFTSQLHRAPGWSIQTENLILSPPCWKPFNGSLLALVSKSASQKVCFQPQILVASLSSFS